MIDFLKDYDPSTIALKIIEMQKTAINNTFDSIISFQNQSEKMTNSFIDQIPYLAPEARKVYNEWFLAFKKGQDEYKKTCDESFKKFESYFSDTKKSTGPTKGKSASK